MRRFVISSQTFLLEPLEPRNLLSVPYLVEQIGDLNNCDSGTIRGDSIDDSGRVAGNSNVFTGVMEPFLWARETGMVQTPRFVDLDPTNFGESYGWAKLIRADGTVYGDPFFNGQKLRTAILREAHLVDSQGNPLPLSALGDLVTIITWKLNPKTDEYEHGNPRRFVVLDPTIEIWPPADAVSGSGTFIGKYAPIDSPNSVPFVADDLALRDLNAFVPPDSGWHIESPRDINNLGQIIATGTIDIGEYQIKRSFLFTPIPGGTFPETLGPTDIPIAWLPPDDFPFPFGDAGDNDDEEDHSSDDASADEDNSTEPAADEAEDFASLDMPLLNAESLQLSNSADDDLFTSPDPLASDTPDPLA